MTQTGGYTLKKKKRQRNVQDVDMDSEEYQELADYVYNLLHNRKRKLGTEMKTLCELILDVHSSMCDDDDDDDDDM